MLVIQNPNLACESSCLHKIEEIRNNRAGMDVLKQHTMQVDQLNVPVSPCRTVGSARPAFDETYARSTARAYERYVEGGCREGNALEDWLDAERAIQT